jgi:hypothetical protein
MPRKVFTAGEVLAAADVNSFLMDQTVMTFAGTAARGSAIGTAVEGMTTYLEDSDNIEIYNGSAWKSPFGLTLVKSQVVGSSVASVTVSDVFSSAYDSYKIVYQAASGFDNTNMKLKLGAQASDYNGLFINGTFSGGAGIVLDQVAGGADWPYVGGNGLVSAEVHSPNLAVATVIHAFVRYSTKLGTSVCTAGSTVHTAFTLTPGSGTLTGGTIYVYGYRKN